MKRKTIGYYNYTVLLTYAGMLTACVGVILAMNGRFWDAVFCLMVAGICDMFDGAVASTRPRDENEKRFGIQIDSLSDLVSFGVMPGFTLYAMAPSFFTGVCVCTYILAALIRLAYFNVLEENRQQAEVPARPSFMGVPVTTIALVLPLYYVIFGRWFPQLLTSVVPCCVVLLGTAISFVTPVELPKVRTTGKIVLLVVGILEALGMFLLVPHI